MKHMPMKQRITLAAVLLPMIALGQLQTPAQQAEVALRARVTEYLQYHVEGNFRKAYDLVAEDTKDEFFNSGKVQLKGFTIDKLVFNDNFTKATVTVMVSKTMNMLGQDFPVTLPSTLTWKIENGKWVWYDDVKSSVGNLMDPPNRNPEPPAPQSNSNNTSTAADILPKTLDDKTLAMAAQSILQQVGVDKKEVTLLTNRVSEDKVVFHNGMSGGVQLEIEAPDLPGFSATAEQSGVKAGADVPVVFRYQPGDGVRRGDPITVQLVVQPLNRAFEIRVNFSAAGPATQQ